MRGRGITHLFVYSPNDNSSLGFAGSKPGDMNSISASHIWKGSVILGPILPFQTHQPSNNFKDSYQLDLPFQIFNKGGVIRFFTFLSVFNIYYTTSDYI